MKLPFFPRSNKTESLKPKKTRKRKLFCFKCSKKKSTNKLGRNGVQVDLIPENRKSKRSYEENVCPACKKKFITFESNDKHKPWDKKWHNRLISEKYTDTIVNKSPERDINKYTKFSSGISGYHDIYDNQRNKREEPGILMRRELDVIQQMIEHDDVRLPSSAKTTGPPSE